MYDDNPKLFIAPLGTDGAESLKGSHRMGDGPIFLKTSPPHSLMTTYRRKLLSDPSRWTVPLNMTSTHKLPLRLFSIFFLVSVVSFEESASG
jgi:hypothetical protein